MEPPSLTLGVEEEYQIIDPKTRELTSYITQILEADHRFLEQVKPELHQSIVEVGTKVCRTPAEVREELVSLRGAVMELAARNGLKIAAAGTHPFSSWLKQEITPLERYLGVKEDMQDLAQRLLIFGTHVHIGIEDRDFLIDALNVVPVLPAAHSLPLDQLALLERTQHRAEIVPQYRLPRLPPDRRATDRPQLGGVRPLPGDADLDGVYPQWQQDLVGRPAELELPHPGVPDLRRVHPGGRGGGSGRDLAGYRGQAVEDAPR